MYARARADPEQFADSRDILPSPTTTSKPTPTENAQERQQRLDFNAAEKAYLTADNEFQRLLMAGGASEPTKTLRETTAGGIGRP